MKNVLIIAAAAAGLFASPLAAYPAGTPFLIVPLDMNPDNVEFTVPGLSVPILKVWSNPWGMGGKCGDSCLGFEGKALPGGFTNFPSMRLSDTPFVGGFLITKIVWTCGKDADGVGKPCPDQKPVDIYVQDDTGKVFTYTPSANSPYFAVPEPQTWALSIAGLGLVGLTLRRWRAATA